MRLALTDGRINGVKNRSHSLVVSAQWCDNKVMKEHLPPLSEQAKNLRPGIYEHYKGNQYHVLGVARHSETMEEVVMYQARYAGQSFWVRPVAMFYENVELSGERKPRFRFLHA